jgi:hypothetical protein
MRPVTRILYALCDRIAVLWRAERAKEKLATSQGDPQGYQGAEPLGWFLELFRSAGQKLEPLTRDPRTAFAARLILAATVLVAESRALAPTIPPSVARYVADAGLTDVDVAALVAGRPVTKVLANPTKEEVAVFGAIRIDAPPTRIVELYLDITRFESGPGVLSVGRFSTPPVLSDVASLELPRVDLDDLSNCRVGDCQINLTQEAIERFQQQVGWSSPDARARANQVLREMLLEYVRTYQSRGNDGLAVYRHRDRPLPLKESSLGLLRGSQPFISDAPQVAQYFEAYNRAPLPAGGEELFYWSQVAFGLKPVTRANHVVVAPVILDQRSVHALVSRTIYASHYFLEGLEIRFVIPSQEAPDRSSYFVNVNRAHSDSLSGVLGRLSRGKVHRSVRDSMERYVDYVKRYVEGR